MSGDPVGTVGGAHGMGSAELDIGAAAAGGTRFLDRLEQLANAKDSHDRALAELNLGRTAQAAYLHASQLHAEARDANAKATQALNDANSRATATLNEANATATRIIAEAKEEGKRIAAAAEVLKTDAYTHHDRKVAEAQALMDEAQRIKDAAQAERDEVALAMQQTTHDREKLAAERKAFEERRHRFNAAYDRVSAVLREVGRALG